ncbi:ATP-binding protein [Oceaniradius stylonematis]|uniref:ATP-binding protein n=1 Tax=Oceaniradius stylonematis TaxID=2184161 RepID=UPI00273E9219|nr:DUF87 domain-containing protein [Oceaniradius stylonematis]
MYRKEQPDPGEAQLAKERAPLPRRNRTEGHVIECDGNRAVISADVEPGGAVSEDYWSVGTLITIRADSRRTVGMLYQIESVEQFWQSKTPNKVRLHVELVGEIGDDADGRPVFNGGLSSYPHLGAAAHRIRNADLQAIFANTDPSAVSVGALSQSRDIDAMVSINSMISRHFAVVGTTGVGKSTTVSLLVRKLVATRSDVGILVLDPHNEFASAFPDISVKIDDTNLDLPFWLFRLEEFVEVLFRGRPAEPEEVDILRDLIPEAKQKFKAGGTGRGARKPGAHGNITADTPIPYRVSDLLALIDHRMGKLDGREARSALKSLAARINAAVHDPRYRFMFAHKTIVDNLAEVLSHIYRVPADGKPVTIFQLNGIPSEVVNAVVSVLCRLAFEMSVWSKARIKTVVLCEEAHRYIPADVGAGFGPTRAAIARIAKEGRKYGVSLGIITQRPSELDPTILSQCNTMFAMRLGNDADQQIMRKAITGASRSYINFLPSLANREAIAFDQGVSTPMRLMVEAVADDCLPGNELGSQTETETDDGSTVDMAALLQTIRDPGDALTDDETDDGLAVYAETAAVGEQRPSVSARHSAAETREPMPAGPVPAEPVIGAGDAHAGLFTYEGPLRRDRDKPAHRRSDPPSSPKRPEKSGSSRDLISRFRTRDKD